MATLRPSGPTGRQLVDYLNIIGGDVKPGIVATAQGIVLFPTFNEMPQGGFNFGFQIYGANLSQIINQYHGK